MTRVSDGATDSDTYYEYDAVRRATLQHHPNATTTYFSYDAAGRLSEKVTKKGWAHLLDPAAARCVLDERKRAGAWACDCPDDPKWKG